MADPKLGRLEKLDLREIWKSEAQGFTPWLAQQENIALLGEAIDLQLEVMDIEKDVGPFRADIYCKNTADSSVVLIENQLERTDHNHLGQILTYAAGLNAVTIIWVAREFQEEHRAVLDWLNEITEEKFNFFGLEIELWKIGNSEAAPKFNIVSKPNDWTKSIVGPRPVTASQKTQLEFWYTFKEYVESKETVIRPTKPLPQNWMNISIGRSEIKLTAIASHYDSENRNWDSHEIRAQLELLGAESKAQFAILEQQREAIEQEFGEPLNWYCAENVRACRIFTRLPADLNKKESWLEYCEWLLSKLERLHKTFSRRVREL